MTDSIIPLSYVSLKFILEYTDLKTRVKIRHGIPEIRNTERQTPSHLQHFNIVNLSSHRFSITIDGREWMFEKTDSPNETKVVFSYENHKITYNVQMTSEQCLDKLAECYLTNKSVIQRVVANQVPEFLSNKSSQSYTLFIGELHFWEPKKELFLAYRKFIDASYLRNIQLYIDTDTLELLEDPIVKNVDHLMITFNAGTKVNKKKVMDSIENRKVTLNGPEDSIIFFEYQIRKWLTDGRPIGTQFRMEFSDARMGMINLRIVLSTTFNVNFLIWNPELRKEAIHISMSPNSDLVVYEVSYAIICRVVAKNHNAPG